MSEAIYLLQKDNLRFIEALNQIAAIYPKDEKVQAIVKKVMNAK